MINAYPDHIVQFLPLMSETLSRPIADFEYISVVLLTNETCERCGKPILCIHAHHTEDTLGVVIKKHVNIHVCSNNCCGVVDMKNSDKHEDGECFFCGRSTEEDPDAIINDGED